MTITHTDSIDHFIRQLREFEPAGVPVLTVTSDLGVGGDGRPTALRMLRQAMREGIDRYPAAASFSADRDWLDDEAEALETVIEEATARGAAGLAYVGAAGTGFLTTIETAYPLRNAIDIDERPCLFELVRYRYLVGGAVVLASISVREVDLMRVRYGVTEVTERVDPPERLEKLKQRSKREGFGAADGSGGHAMNRVQQHIERRRVVFAHEAAEHIARLAEPGDIVLLAGVDSARSAIRRQLPQTLRTVAADAPALDPTEDERTRTAWLTDIVVEAQYAAGDEAAARWFGGEWLERAEGGLDAGLKLAEQGRLGTILLHEDAVDHFGDAADVRSHVPHHDPRQVEALTRAALDQGAELFITRDPRALSQHQGVLSVARF